MLRACQRTILNNTNRFIQARYHRRGFFGEGPRGALMIGIPFAKHHFKQVKPIMNCKISQIDEKHSSLAFSTHPVNFGHMKYAKTESIINIDNIDNNENSGFLLVYKPRNFEYDHILPLDMWDDNRAPDASYWCGSDIKEIKEFRNYLKNAGICLEVPASHFLHPHKDHVNENDNYSKWLKKQDLTKPLQTFIRSYVLNPY